MSFLLFKKFVAKEFIESVCFSVMSLFTVSFLRNHSYLTYFIEFCKYCKLLINENFILHFAALKGFCDNKFCS